MHLSGSASELIFRCVKKGIPNNHIVAVSYGAIFVKSVPSYSLCLLRLDLSSNEAFPCLLSREPRGFAFVQFVDGYDASEAQYHMNGQIFAGREISVVLAAETRKRPEEMRQRTRVRGPSGSGYGGRRSSYYGRSRSRSVSRSRSPRYPSGSRSRYRSRSSSPVPRRRADYSVSPSRRHAEHPRSPRGPRRERDADNGKSYSPGYDNAADQNENGNGYREKPTYETEEARGHWRSSPGRVSRSPSGSRSRSADLSPRRSR